MKRVPWSYVVNLRDLPLEFSFEEIITRTWTQAPGQTVGLMRTGVFKLSPLQPLEVLVATFGDASSNRAVCIDFYAAQETLQGMSAGVQKGKAAGVQKGKF
jgi:hypothetical protein